MSSSGTEFIFNDITDKELRSYIENAFVFNLTEGELLEESLVENKFDVENMGISVEKVNIFTYNKDTGSYIDVNTVFDLSTCFDEVIESSGSGYYVMAKVVLNLVKHNIEYSRILVVRRISSSYVFDKVQSGVSSFIYNICDDEVGKVFKEHPSLQGYLAKMKRCVSSIEDIRNTLIDDLQKGNLSQYNYNNYIGYLID